MADLVTINWYTSCEISTSGSPYTRDFQCCICGEKDRFKFLGQLSHGRKYQCPGCGIYFARYGNLVKADVQSITKSSPEFRNKAIKLNDYFRNSNSWEDAYKDAYSGAERKLTPVFTVAKEGARSDNEELSGLWAKFSDIVKEADRLKRSIQRDTKRLRDVTNIRIALVEKIGILKGEVEEKPDEDLVRFSFILNEE